MLSRSIVDQTLLNQQQIVLLKQEWQLRGVLNAQRNIGN
jgi:hypothetical protein